MAELDSKTVLDVLMDSKMCYQGHTMVQKDKNNEKIILWFKIAKNTFDKFK